MPLLDQAVAWRKSFKGRGRMLQKPPKESGVYFGHFATFAPFFIES